MRTQQDLVYRAEAEAPAGPTFATIDELEAWLRREMLDQPWWHERFPRVRGIFVAASRDAHGSVGGWSEADGYGQIEMAPTHWCAKYVCHEVAHVAAAPDGSTSHDPLFVRVYLELVYRTLGTDAWVDLRGRFLDAGVVIDPRDDT